MAKSKQLTKRQLAVIEELFSDELTEQQVLNKYKVSRTLFNKWLSNETFTEHFDKCIIAAYRQSTAYLARYAGLAASKLVRLTESDKPDVARRACLDIISMLNDSNEKPQFQRQEPKIPEQTLSSEAAGRILAALAEVNHSENMNKNSDKCRV